MAAILLVDPDAAQSSRIRSALEAAGHASFEARGVGDGLTILRDGGIDLALVHYAAGVDLDELARGFQRLPDPPPFVLVSGAVDGPTMSARYGASAFVARPVADADLVTLVGRMLDQRHAPAEFEESPTRPNERRPDSDGDGS